ncbi:MAG: RHS repeat protein [Gammaproteobacteria bacterium]|nr:RHS repeat protein [Gammaproteobacteria bacterium]
MKSVTNAVGHLTTYDSYDTAGRVTQITDPNGLTTVYDYEPRGKVRTVTQTPATGTARVTRYTYNPAGNVTSVTLPDGVVLTYTYNAAQQLTSITDNQSNRVTYTYDLKGNRTQAATYDLAGTLVRQIDTAYDLRDHVNAVTAGSSITQQLTDAIGNLTKETDPKQVAASSGIATTHTYDALNRLIKTVNNLGGITTYGYNPNDQLIQVKASNNATTTYEYDDLGNFLKETSPDRGTTTYSYDDAGNVKQVTDARGITVKYTYDALNRLKLIDHPTDVDVTYVYDTATNCTVGKGCLCQVTDESGTTVYGYDAFGNVVTQRKTELGKTYLTQTTYDAGNRIKSITYPDNRVVTYPRDTLGRITGVTGTANSMAPTPTTT